MNGQSNEPVVSVHDLTHRYGSRTALDGLSFEVGSGEIFGVLGPNGSGKSTLFHILSTLLPPADGTVLVFGHDPRREPDAVRGRIGIVFQQPSLDPKLKVVENLRCQARIYGMSGDKSRRRVSEAMETFQLTDRAADLVETLSGGLKRRVELAKGLLHRPSLLILDEPSTGLDPAASRDLWNTLERLRADLGMTIMVTTHIMEEAERCDRLALLDRGRLVALDRPRVLKSEVGGEIVSIRASEPEAFASRLREEMQLEGASVVDGLVRVRRENGAALAAELMERWGEDIDEVTVGRPSLRDVFLERTGHQFQSNGSEVAST